MNSTRDSISTRGFARDLAGVLEGDLLSTTTLGIFTTPPPAITVPKTSDIPPTQASTTEGTTTTLASLASTSEKITGQTFPPATTAEQSQQTSVGSWSITSASPEYSIVYTPEAPVTPPAEATEWKVIGLLVLSIVSIAAVVLSVVFFDTWWGLFRGLLCGRKSKREEFEEMVPDWDKRSWEFRLASEDGHRYPTMISLESMVKGQSQGQSRTLQNNAYLAAPQPVYSTEYDPHPLEPLMRRPRQTSLLWILCIVPLCVFWGCRQLPFEIIGNYEADGRDGADTEREQEPCFGGKSCIGLQQRPILG